jgi:hypothetical protein
MHASGITVYRTTYYARGFEAMFLYGANIQSNRERLHSINVPGPSFNLTIASVRPLFDKFIACHRDQADVPVLPMSS